MGICVTKKDRESADLLVRHFLTNSPTDPQSIREFIDLRKARTAPVLSLARNSLYLHRVEQRKALESTCEDAREDLSISIGK